MDESNSIFSFAIKIPNNSYIVVVDKFSIILSVFSSNAIKLMGYERAEL